MKRLIALGSIAFALLIVALLFFGSWPVGSEPERSEIIGEWECADLPRGFVRQMNGKIEDLISRISIREDGSLSALNFPQRSPYQLIDIDGTWDLTDPSMTPSGIWAVEFQSQHLSCKRRLGRLILRYTISGKDNYYAEYKKR
ncbi:MAG: hypothetical protein ACSHYF_10600 [Verrucomicrobiaceae bacterium]